MAKRNPYKVGQRLCTFGQVTMLHGEDQVVMRIGNVEGTFLNSEVWDPEKDVKPAPANQEVERG